MEKVTYHEARKNQEKRQQYLEQIDFGPAAEYIKEVRYMPEGIIIDGRDYLMTTRPAIRAELFRVLGTKSTVKVAPRAFEHQENDFLSFLVEHEGTHAINIAKNPQLIIYGLRGGLLCDWLRGAEINPTSQRIRCISERRAINAQLAAHATGKRPMSDEVVAAMRARNANYKKLGKQRGR